MATLLLKSQYDNYYTRLNQIRSKHRRPLITVHTVTQNAPALSSQMQTLQASITDVKNNTDRHLKNASIDITVPNIAQGNTILLSTNTKIDTILTQMYNVCHYYGSDYSSDDSYDSSNDSYTPPSYSGNDGYTCSYYGSCHSYTCSSNEDYYGAYEGGGCPSY